MGAFQGDDYCDDGNNNDGCDWDGGDCCGPTYPNINRFDYCTDCMCADPDYMNPCGLPLKGSEMEICGSPGFVGDGFCDDNNNVGGCAWDGGDCCGAESSHTFCDECVCRDCTYGEPCRTGLLPSTAGCEVRQWAGDGI